MKKKTRMRRKEKKVAVRNRDSHDTLIWLLLTSLILFHILNNYNVLRIDSVYFQGDAAELYLNSIRFLRAFPMEGLLGKIRLFYSHTDDIHPPLFGAVSALFMALFGTSQDMAVMSNAPFLAVLLISTFLLGKDLFDKETGILSAILLSFFPAAFSISRAYMSDYSVATMTTLSMLLLVRTTKGAGWRDAILFGMVLGLTALTQPYFSLFLLGPFLIISGTLLARPVRAGDVSSIKNALLKVALAGLIAFAIASPWYVLHSGGYFSIQGCRLAFLREATGLSARPWLLGNRLVMAFASSLYLPIALLLGAVMFYYPFKGKHRGLLLSWLLIPPVSFVLIGITNEILLPLLLFPALPAASLILASSSLRALRMIGPTWQERRGNLIAILLLLIEVPFFLAITYAGGGNLLDAWGGEATGYDASIARLDSLGRTSSHQSGFLLEEIAETMAEELSGPLGNKTAVFLNPRGTVSEALAAETQVTLMRQGVEPRFLQCGGLLPQECAPTVQLNSLACMEKFSSAEYVILEQPSGVPNDYRVWWAFEEPTFSTQMGQLSQDIHASLSNYSLLLMLPRTLAPGQTYTADGGPFEWLNNSVWVLKRRQ